MGNLSVKLKNAAGDYLYPIPAAGGTTGQVLKKTAAGVEWGDEASGVTVTKGDGYLKFSDGLLVCYGSIAAFSTSTKETVTVTFPVSFSSASSFSASATFSGATAIGADKGDLSIETKAASGMTIHCDNQTGAGCDWIAIGRWN